MLVNSTANGRYEKLQTKKTTEDGEPAPFPDLDAQVVVYVSQNALTAWLLVYPPVSQGKELDREMLAQALEKEHVSLGLNGGLISELPQSVSVHNSEQVRLRNSSGPWCGWPGDGPVPSGGGAQAGCGREQPGGLHQPEFYP